MNRDLTKMMDSQRLAVLHKSNEPLKWMAKVTVKKYHGTEAEGNLEVDPYEIVEREGNLAVTVGMTAILNLLTAEAAPTAFSNANGYIAVGSNATAANVGDTTLGTELDRQGMDGIFPTVSGAECTWQSVFNTGASDGDWREWGLFNAAAAGTMLNHKIVSLGTKSGGTWTLAVTITLS